MISSWEEWNPYEIRQCKQNCKRVIFSNEPSTNLTTIAHLIHRYLYYPLPVKCKTASCIIDLDLPKFEEKKVNFTYTSRQVYLYIHIIK